MSEYADEYQTSILTKEGLYTLKQYKDEKELEKLVVSSTAQIFGSNSIYFDIKQRIESKAKMRITDGLLLDLTNKMFWIVEHELSRHDPYKEIEPQINGFVRALSNEETISKVSDTVYTELKKDKEKMSLAKKAFGEDVYYSITKLLRERCGILIIIDKVTPQIEELKDDFALKRETRLIEFKTYEKDGKIIHAFTPLQTQSAILTAGQYSIEEHLSRATPEAKQVLNTLRSRILKLDRVTEKVSKYWLSYGLGTKRGAVFVYINSKRITRSFRVLLKPKRYLVDPRGILKASGSTFAPYYFRVRDIDDLNYGLELITQCYNQYKH